MAKKKDEIEEGKKGPFKNWCQVNKKGVILSSLSIAIQENPTAARLLILMISKANRVNEVVLPYITIQKALGVSKATVQRAIRYLKDKNFIAIWKNGTSNCYVLNPRLVWSGYGYLLPLCRFKELVSDAGELPEDTNWMKIRVSRQNLCLSEIPSDSNNDEEALSADCETVDLDDIL